MDKQSLIEQLVNFRNRLDEDIYPAYRNSGSDLGNERFNSWKRAIFNFLDINLPKYKSKLAVKLYESSLVVPRLGYSQFQVTQYIPSTSFIDSLIMDINNDEVESLKNIYNSEKEILKPSLQKNVFIVHGHDNATKERTARFLEKLGFKAIILHEQASGGKTIIEKLEHFTNVGFGIVLYTPDDEGSVKNERNYQPRARQNVVFEHGLLIGKLGREKVFPLVTDHSVELPGDISGMVYLSDTNWEVQLAKEIRELGYQIDMNQVV